MEQNELRYERALMRADFVIHTLLVRRFNAVVPRTLLEPGYPQRRALADVPRALLNVPVEYARYRWGWSPTKTKLIAGLAFVLPAAYIMYVHYWSN